MSDPTKLVCAPTEACDDSVVRREEAANEVAEPARALTFDEQVAEFTRMVDEARMRT